MVKKIKFLKKNYLNELEGEVNILLQKGWSIEGNLVLGNDVFCITVSKSI